jgi:hypothetical protein
MLRPDTFKEQFVSPVDIRFNVADRQVKTFLTRGWADSYPGPSWKRRAGAWRSARMPASRTTRRGASKAPRNPSARALVAQDL